MNRLLRGTSWGSSVLAAACLVLGLLAMPSNVARADDGPTMGNCGGRNMWGCTATESTLCDGQGTTCRASGFCDCKWHSTANPEYFPDEQYCGCFNRGNEE